MYKNKISFNNDWKKGKKILIFFAFVSLFKINFPPTLPAKPQVIFNELVHLSTSQIQITLYDSRENCVFLKTPSNKNIVINGIEDRRSQWYRDIRNNLREPMRVFFFFKSNRIADIDIAVLTTPDHVAAMRRMINDFRVRKVYVPDVPVVGHYRVFLDYLARRNIRFEYFKTGDKIVLESAEVEVLESSRKYNGRYIESSLRISYGETEVFLPGNINLASQYYLKNKLGGGVNSSVMRLVNHGRSSVDIDFIKAVNPQHAIVFADPDKIHRDKANATVEKIKDAGAKVFRSDPYNTIKMEEGYLQRTRNATVRIISDGQEYKIVSAKNLGEIKEELQNSKPPPIKYSYNRICCDILESKIEQETPYVDVLLDGDYFPAVAYEIDQAVHCIYMVMFFVNMGQRNTNPVNLLIDKLIQARQRGVKVKVLLEEPQEKEEDDFDFLLYNNRKVYRWLTNAGIDVRMSPPEEKTHHKYIVFDYEFTVVGNHNWSQTALEGTQYEAAVLIQSGAVARRFINYYYDSID